MDEALYVLGQPGGVAYRVAGPARGGSTPVAGLGPATGLVVWPRQDRSFVGYTNSDYTHHKRPFGSPWTLVTYPELVVCRLQGRITGVLGDPP